MPISYLPLETLDYILDFLHDKPETLKECCLVSKIMDPTHSRTPIRRYQVPFRRRPRVVEEDVPGSF